MTVRILHGGLEEDPDSGEIILRGVLDQDTLKYINMGWYQREQGFSNAHTNEIISGFFLHNGRVADITIGMRGARTQNKGSTYNLLDKCFCIDGGQRLYAAAQAIRLRPSLKLAIGAKVHFNTNEEIENEMFCRLGTTQTRISASVLMRNQRKKVPAVQNSGLTQQRRTLRVERAHRLGSDQDAQRTDDRLCVGKGRRRTARASWRGAQVDQGARTDQRLRCAVQQDRRGLAERQRDPVFRCHR